MKCKVKKMGKYLDPKSDDKTREVDPELLSVPEIKEAIFLAEEAGYSPAELIGYEDYWKAVSSDRTIRAESYMKGEAKATLKIAKGMKEKGVSISLIKEYTGLSDDEIEKL